jgi:hypothetical protein
MVIEEAVISGITNAGSFAIVTYFLLKYVVFRLDTLRVDTSMIKDDTNVIKADTQFIRTNIADIKIDLEMIPKKKI